LVESVRNAAFTTVSIQTTTGFCTTDFDRWPFIAKAVLITLMFVGGCSGSTAGGIKVIRIWIAIKVMLVQTEAVFRPGVIRPIRVSGAVVDRDLQLATVAYILSVIVLFGLGWCGIMLLEDGYSGGCSSTTAATASVATLCTVGPGLDGIGAVQNYGWFSAPTKLLLCVLMALGRLEIFAILVLLRPGFWERR
jgi:trk system potassium uptake protein TrkH